MANERQPRSALAVLGEINKGALVAELSHVLAGLSRDVLVLGKPGSITLKLTLRPSKLADNGLDIVDNLTVAAPKPERRPSLFFASGDGDLTRNDPNQHELPLKVATVAAKKANE